MLKSIFGKSGDRVLLSAVAVVAIGLTLVFINSAVSPIPVPGGTLATTASDRRMNDPGPLDFYPNGHGQPIGSVPLQLEVAGNARTLTINMEVVDFGRQYSPSGRLVLVRNPAGLIFDQIISVKTDSLERSSEQAMISEIDGSGNRGLFIPVEKGMRFVQYLVLAWDPSSEGFIPLKAAESFPIEIDGAVTKTATLTNPRIENGAWMHESRATGSGQEFVRCSRIMSKGYQLVFEANFNYAIETGGAGSWQLEIHAPRAKQRGLAHEPATVKTANYSSYQIDDSSPGWTCADWVAQLLSLQQLRNASQLHGGSKRPATPPTENKLDAGGKA